MSNKKFFIWLGSINLMLIIITIMVGFIFIKDNYYDRFYILGRGVGEFIYVSDTAVILIYFFWYKKRKKK